jgi:hypothetical protein
MNTGTATGFPIGRTIVAMVAGIVFTAILSVATDLGLWAAGAFPPIGDVHTTPQLLVATVYRTVFGIGGSYLTASLAPRSDAACYGPRGPGTDRESHRGVDRSGFGPEWYSWALVVLALPTAWLAGKLHQIRSTRVPIIRQGERVFGDAPDTSKPDRFRSSAV